MFSTKTREFTSPRSAACALLGQGKHIVWSSDATICSNPRPEAFELIPLFARYVHLELWIPPVFCGMYLKRREDTYHSILINLYNINEYTAASLTLVWFHVRPRQSSYNDRNRRICGIYVGQLVCYHTPLETPTSSALKLLNLHQPRMSWIWKALYSWPTVKIGDLLVSNHPIPWTLATAALFVWNVSIRTNLTRTL